MIMNKYLFIIILCFSCLSSCTSETVRYNETYAQWNRHELTVSTGNFTRVWNIDRHGLVSKKIIDDESGYNWSNGNRQNTCDWDYCGLIDNSTEGKLVSVHASHSNDSSFTSDHLAVFVEYEYPKIETRILYEIRAYPETAGLYTNLYIKGSPHKHIDKNAMDSDDIRFDMLSGENTFNYKANAFVPEYIARHACSDNDIEYRISGLNALKKYKIGVSWWNSDSTSIVQNLVLYNPEKDNGIRLLEAHEIPSCHINNEPEEFTFDVPEGSYKDGEIHLVIEKVSGKATVSEIWVYEYGGQTKELIGDPERLSDLRESAGDGTYSLAGYLNCGNSNKSTANGTGRIDYFPIDTEGATRHYIGYYNDTQHRNRKETPLLKECIMSENIAGTEQNAWASILSIGKDGNSLTIVKESHKCVNQHGHDTGSFIVTETGISNTGTAMMPEEVLPDRYRKAWATWIISSSNDELSKGLALKKFERMRYPVDHDTDVYLIANAWGSGRGANATLESNIIEELKVQNYLGIDVQQIDDGYFYAGTRRPSNLNIPYRAHESKYPSGFENVRDIAAGYGIRLGLWFPAMPVSLADMKHNYDEGNFKYYKLDFADFRNYAQMENMIRKIRTFEQYAGHTAKVNWDVTESAARFGYFWAKEYGAVFLENRRHDKPLNVIYEPYLVLRDLWHLSKYCNLNKFQGTIQNKETVSADLSDAYRYSHAYTVGIALMSTPLFFQETKFYSNKALSEIKTVIDAYKPIRHSLYDCYVFPVGEEPDNASWSGFQAISPDGNSGFMTVFREINNNNPSYNMAIYNNGSKKMKIKDLISGKTEIIDISKANEITVFIPKPGEFRFLSYEYVN